MGWLYYHKDKTESALDNLRRELFGESWMAKQNAKIVGAAKVGRVCYFAVECPATEAETVYVPNAEGRITVCYVILTSHTRDHYNFGYKDMTETCGPNEDTCPASILNRLSELRPVTEATKDGSLAWATRWRERCRERIAKKKAALKLVQGLRVRLPEPVRFQGGVVLGEFTVAVLPGRKRNKTVFYANGGYYRLDGAHRALLQRA